MQINGIDIEIKRKRIKNMHIYVKPPEGSVLVTVPLRTSDAAIREFISSRMVWIKKSREKVRRRAERETVSFFDGSSIRIFGKARRLCISSAGRYSYLLCEDELMLFLPEKQIAVFHGGSRDIDGGSDSGKICKPSGDSFAEDSGIDEKRLKDCLEPALKDILKSQVKRRLPIWEEKTGLKAGNISIRRMKTRWGSCTVRTGAIRINLQLVYYPVYCLDYILLHELLHIRIADHGPRFKAELDRHMPGWRDIRKELCS